MKRRPKAQPVTEHRAADPDQALERTFESGKALDVLPPKDRRPYTAPEPLADADVPVIASILAEPVSRLPVVDNSKPMPPNVGDPRHPEAG